MWPPMPPPPALSELKEPPAAAVHGTCVEPGCPLPGAGRPCCTPAACGRGKHTPMQPCRAALAHAGHSLLRPRPLPMAPKPRLPSTGGSPNPRPPPSPGVLQLSVRGAPARRAGCWASFLPLPGVAASWMGAGPCARHHCKSCSTRACTVKAASACTPRACCGRPHPERRPSGRYASQCATARPRGRRARASRSRPALSSRPPRTAARARAPAHQPQRRPSGRRVRLPWAAPAQREPGAHCTQPSHCVLGCFGAQHLQRQLAGSSAPAPARSSLAPPLVQPVLPPAQL